MNMNINFIFLVIIFFVIISYFTLKLSCTFSASLLRNSLFLSIILMLNSQSVIDAWQAFFRLDGVYLPAQADFEGET